MKVRGMALYNAPVSQGSRIGRAGTRSVRLQGGSLRTALFGVNDGLVSNACLIMGVAGASSAASAVVLSGLAGLLAGAVSMAASEYVSVRAKREFHEYEIGQERDGPDQYPSEDAAELSLIYEARGIDRADARQLADTLIRDPDTALTTLARNELGLNQDQPGSPLAAAMASFLAFAVGAFVPLLPFLLLHGVSALYGTMAAAAICLFGVGATLSLFTGNKTWLGGMRMLLIGAAAGAAAWSIGRAIGLALS
jgi:VIT1/CCC1 family predicted Fe2+/Mn2+ transporter